MTRKELRAREKSLDTGGHGAVPEQAYETGQPFETEPGHGPGPAEETPADVPPPPAAPPSVPAPPAAEPVVHEAGAGQHEDLQAAYAAPASHGYAGDPHYADPVQYPTGHEYHHDTEHGQAHGGHEHHDDFHHEPAYHDDVHHDDVHHEDLHQHASAGHELLAGSTATSVVARPSKKVRRRRRLLALFLTLAVFVTAVAVGAQFLKPLLGGGKASDFPGPGSGEVQVTVDNGEGTRSVAADLESKGIIANADTFLQAFSASGGTLSPGDYTFKSEMKNKDAVDVLLGQDKAKVIYFALSAGLRVNESLQAIAQGSGVSIQQLQALSNAPAQFGLPANAKNLEGYLFPGEYRFPLGTPAKDILQSLVNDTIDELKSQGISDPAKQYEAVTVASIVQAEGGQADYGDVAGAIYNRLKPNDQTGGFLQVDSAVTYGLGTKSFNFTDEQRQDKSNPYNTYANPGLPPGPIGSPGKTAIDAAAKPKANDYLYWVTVNLDTKETKFSRTLAEHNTYVEQYNNWCKANAGRCT